MPKTSVKTHAQYSQQGAQSHVAPLTFCESINSHPNNTVTILILRSAFMYFSEWRYI